MRIISGIYKGRRLKSSRDLSIRPTTDRIKELIFNVLQDFPKERKVTDLFAGSGNLGIEALSRGAGHVYFVERSRDSVSILKKNLSDLGIPEPDYTIIRQDALYYAKHLDYPSELFLLDPPFDYPPLQNLIDSLLSHPDLSREAVVVVEHEINNPLQTTTSCYKIFKQKQIGRSLISFIEKRLNHEKSSDISRNI